MGNMCRSKIGSTRKQRIIHLRKNNYNNEPNAGLTIDLSNISPKANTSMFSNYPSSYKTYTKRYNKRRNGIVIDVKHMDTIKEELSTDINIYDNEIMSV